MCISLIICDDGLELIIDYLSSYKSNLQIIMEGEVHLNTIFSYMKFNKICNLNHPLY